jgi:hypothetical protein
MVRLSSSLDAQDAPATRQNATGASCSLPGANSPSSYYRLVATRRGPWQRSVAVSGLVAAVWADARCLGKAVRAWVPLPVSKPLPCLHPHDIRHFHLGQSQAELGIVAVPGIGQHHALWNASLVDSPNLLQSNVWLGLKLDILGNTSLLPSFSVLDPNVRQIQAMCHWHTRRVCGHREAHGYTAIVPFAHLAAIAAIRVLDARPQR